MRLYASSNSSILSASSRFAATISRKRTKARTTKTLIATADSELSTVAAMIAPCSVKAYGKERLPPRPIFEVANCDIKDLFSREESWNMKSAGNFWRLRFACSFKRFTDTL